MATVSFPIPSTPIPSGTTRTPFVDITSQVSGHTEYEVRIDVSAWSTSDNISVGIEFRIDSNPTPVNGCSLTTNGGVHHGMDNVTVILPSCGEKFPPFSTKLEARARITVPSSGSISGSIDLK